MPVTSTASLNPTAMWMSSSRAYVSLALGDETDTARGATVSIVMFLGATSEPFAPGPGSVRLAANPPRSVSRLLVATNAPVPA